MTDDERGPRQLTIFEAIQALRSERDREVDDLIRRAKNPQSVAPFLLGYLAAAVSDAVWRSAYQSAESACGAAHRQKP